MTTLLAPDTKQRFYDNNGAPLAFGLLTTYAAGTTTPITTYKDSGVISQNTNPITLNFRGEADIWLLPNIAYKFALTDSQGNAIPGWPIDNIVNSQLLTLYGGVDTGGVNAYVINFTANFTSLTDGIIIAWVASNANTGPSTLNVNGLGFALIANQDGSALRAGQITVNQIVQVMYRGGLWYLLAGSFAGGVLAVDGTAPAPSISFLSTPGDGFFHVSSGSIAIALGGFHAGDITQGTASCSLSGVTATVNFNCPYYIVNNVCTLLIPQVSGTSNATTFGLVSTTSAIRPGNAYWLSFPALVDNGTSVYAQAGNVAPSLTPGQTTFSFYKNGNISGWTNAGTKGIGDSVIDAVYTSVTYSLR
jgi:hypothetical protein